MLDLRRKKRTKLTVSALVCWGYYNKCLIVVELEAKIKGVVGWFYFSGASLLQVAGDPVNLFTWYSLCMCVCALISFTESVLLD